MSSSNNKKIEFIIVVIINAILIWAIYNFIY